MRIKTVVPEKRLVEGGANMEERESMLRNRVEGEGNENAPGDVIASTLANHLLGNPNTLINTLSVLPFVPWKSFFWRANLYPYLLIAVYTKKDARVSDLEIDP